MNERHACSCQRASARLHTITSALAKNPAVGGILMFGEANVHPHQPNPLYFLAPLFSGIFVGSLVSASVRVVAQWERMVVLRLGKYHKIGEPGLRFIVPVIDTRTAAGEDVPQDILQALIAARHPETGWAFTFQDLIDPRPATPPG